MGFAESHIWRKMRAPDMGTRNLVGREIQKIHPTFRNKGVGSPVSPAEARGFHPALTGNQDFVEIVFGEEELGICVGFEDFLDGAVGVHAPDLEGSRFLHFDAVAIGEVVSAEGGLGARGARVEESEKASSGAHRRAKPLDYRANQDFRKIVQRGPEQDNIEFPAGEIQVVVEKAFHIELRFGTWLRCYEPVGAGSLMHNIGHVNSVAQRRKEIDIGRGGRTDVQDAQSLFALKMFEQGRPSAGMARHARPDKKRRVNGGGIAVLCSAE